MEHPSNSAKFLARFDLEDDEHDTKEGVLLRYFLQEWELVKSIMNRIFANAGATDSSAVNKIRAIIDKYQEQGHLLEPFLESILNPLMSIVQSKSMQLRANIDEILDIIKPICIIIYSLVTTCGYKSAIRFFPHQVSDFEIAVTLLEKCHNRNPLTSSRQESTGEMETQCVTLLWLYILVLIPFDISSVDTSITNSRQLGVWEPSPLALKILKILEEKLSSAGPMRRFSALVLSRLITRPDMLIAFARFIEWTLEFLQSWTEDNIDQFRLLGIVEALASVFKVGDRNFLLEVGPKTWTHISQLLRSTVAAQNPLLRKYIVKLSQRIGLICLPHRSMSWRYMAKSSLLEQNILLNAKEASYPCSNGQQVHVNDMSTAEIYEDNMDISEIMEEIIEQLLLGLRDSSTIVRWSASKGIGRITACLTSSLAEEVLSSILDQFSFSEGDGSWHGGCLALAEFARRGLLLPVSFPKVVPLIIKALHYDIRRGPHSIGSHVRDAAAYVCWSFGRAYNYSDMKDILEQLAPHLLSVACYDREVNCRRAASAAFQENIGRLGTFPHGIDIVSSADYFSLASRANSFLNVADNIAQYKEYLYPFVDELVDNKISHWDRSLRELAGQALSALAKHDPDYFTGFVLERLMPLTLSIDLCTRHGSTLAVGELVLTLHGYNLCIPVDKQQMVAAIVPAIEKARLYGGKGGEIMRSAVSRFIDCISCSAIYLTEKTKKSLLDTLTDNLKHPSGQIQCAAAEALRHFIQSYLVSLDEKVPNMIISKYLELLNDSNVAARRGAALAFGIFPYEFLHTRWRVIMQRLCKSCLLLGKPDDQDVEARVNAVRGLVSICETLAKASSNRTSQDISIYYFIKKDVMRVLFDALDDYTVDNRGDVGSWVREAAIDGLERCGYILCKYDSDGSIKGPGHMRFSSNEDTVIASNQLFPLFDDNIAANLIKGLAKQAVEKMNKIRGIAARILQRIIHYPQHFIPHIPHREALEEIIPLDTNLKWEDPAISHPCLVQLLQFSCYSRCVLSGYVISVGGLQESLSKTSREALLEFINVSESAATQKINDRERMLSTDLLWLLQNYQKCNRVIIPTIKTIDILLSRRVFFYMKVHTLEFCSGLLDSLLIELKGTKDFTKLHKGISILGYVASLMEPTSLRALAQLLYFLGHKFPKIRKAAADQVYLVILQNTSLMAEDKADRSLKIITETSWEGSLDNAKQKGMELFQLAASHDCRVISTSVEETSMPGKQAGKASADENMSYSSLVDFTGF